MNPIDFLPLAFIEPVSGGIGGVLWLIVSVLATVRVIQETRGVALPVWILVIWGIPCLGGIVALVAVKKNTQVP